MQESLWLTWIARSTGRARVLIAGEEIVWRAVILGRVISHRINLSPIAMAPSATRDHHQLRVNRLTNRGIILPVLLLRHLSISLELTVGGNACEIGRSGNIRL